ncbi:MAG: preprotein translocase subunit Sec61beta [Euryarchaeota archaeon]|jgi:preprotein translocase subunit Sec61beta|nr:preprotein translocase subunit Sec61beta [Euryarchaeota archaeon]
MGKVKTAKKAKKEGGRGGGSGGSGEERGLMSSAGLMRYYDVEESAVKMSPKTILIAGIVIGAIVLGLEIYFGVWPL